MGTEHKGKPYYSDLQIMMAEFLIQLEVGARVPNYRELAAQTNMSVGSVSAALSSMEEQGVVTFQKRGHLGSYLESRSIGGLWGIAEQSPLVIAFTIPSNLRFEGLATAIKTMLLDNGIETYLIFIRGSSTRMKALRENHCHAVVFSQLSVEGECGEEEQVVSELPRGSWLKENQIFYRSNSIEPNVPLRVGVDPDSYDHFQITQLEFNNQQVEYVHTKFTQLPRLLVDGQIDATVWNVEDVRFTMNQGIRKRRLSKHVRDVIGDRDISAAVVVQKRNRIAAAVIKETLNIAELLSIQEQVISGELLPEY